MRVLITGADGFVARHVVPELHRAKHEVVGTALDPQGAQALGAPVEALDVTNADACRRVLGKIRPTHVVHLAAVSSVRWSYDQPDETHRVNVEGTRNVLDAAASLVPAARVLVVGSAEEYGPNDGQPLPELPLAHLRPVSPYAESKVEVERRIEAEPRYRSIAIRTRSFPHFGPGQRRGFFAADVASQLAHVARADGSVRLLTGNLDAIRDYTDVRDVVRAYALLLGRGHAGDVYNVCTGRAVRIRDLLNLFATVAAVPMRAERDPAKDRPSEIPTLVGDNRKLRETTGWEPGIALEQTVRDVLAWWKHAGAAQPLGVSTDLTAGAPRRQ